jgi:hypothetical protein
MRREPVGASAAVRELALNGERGSSVMDSGEAAWQSSFAIGKGI